MFVTPLFSLQTRMTICIQQFFLSLDDINARVNLKKCYDWTSMERQKTISDL